MATEKGVGTYKAGFATGSVVGLIAGALLGGVLMKPGQAGIPRLARGGGSQTSSLDLPIKRIGVPTGADHLKLVEVWFAATAEHRNVAWTEWGGNPSAKPVVLGWDKPGRWPVLDVPAGWCVVWMEGNRILGISDADGRQTNMVMAADPVTRAVLLPGGLRPTAGKEFAYMP